MKATWITMARRILPGYPSDFLDTLLWNHTAFPLVGPLHVARQLKKWKRFADEGWSE